VALALNAAAFILFCLANAFPLLELQLQGTIQEATIPGCARILADLGWPWLSAIMITTVILAPMVHLGGMIYVLFQIRQTHSRLLKPNKWTARIFRVVEQFGAWGMAEVFVLGIIVSYVKLAKMAIVVPGPSLFGLVAFILVGAAAISALDTGFVWNALGKPPTAHGKLEGATAQGAGLVACHTCDLLSPLGTHSCPRCEATLHSRKPESRERTWALLITALILYLPSNLLPVMQVVSLGRATSDTILGGIFYFIRSGSWHLALIIFIASIVVPILKILILGFLLISEHRRSDWRRDHRASLYRLTEMVGRWSMLDIFVITLMVAMVALGHVSSITPGPGSVAFALMVIATMLAVQFFDPRLLWDSLAPASRTPRREDSDHG
jgi:paraquat-inducible protein A